MMHPIPPSLLVALVATSLAFPPCLWSQAVEKKEPSIPYNVVPADINEHRTVVPAPENFRPVRVAIYDGPGVFGNGVPDVTKAVGSLPGSTIQVLGPGEVGTTDLSAFDVIAFTGGSGSKQAAAIGEAGKTNVLKFVRGGGGYLGICGGSFLACSGFKWGLGVINAKTVSPKWQRGIATVDAEMTGLAGVVFGSAAGAFKVRYANGPIIQPDPNSDLPPYQPLAIFRSEVARNGTPVGVMVGAPGAVVSTLGKGRVFLSSPHPEVTPGLEYLIPRALLWVAGQGADVTPSPSSLP